MTKTRLGPDKLSAEFVRRFRWLKGATKDDPQHLASVFASRPKETRDHLKRLTEIANWFEEAPRWVGKPYVKQVDPEFPKARGRFIAAYVPEVDKLLVGDLEWLLLSRVTGLSKDGFYPDEMNAGDFVDELIRWTEEQLEHRQDENYDAFAMPRLEAYRYLRRHGLDLSGAASRIRNLPVVAVPQHVSDRYSDSAIGSLFLLVDEAVRAYVFGAPYAAIAMCRAILELILREHYLIDRLSGGAGDPVREAERHFPWLKKENLAAKRQLAHDILHSLREEPSERAEVERAAINFIKTIRILIERAPNHS
jgi:hypothetical protein